VLDAISVRILHVRALLAARVPLILKVKVMRVPSILQGDSLKRLLQGAAAGAAATLIVGFSLGGWTLASTVDQIANTRVRSAVVAVLAPICVDQFRAAVNASANLTELSTLRSVWDRDRFMDRGGWAIMPGSDRSNRAVAEACAETLGTLKAADLQ